jgi:hypothetical protein
VKVLIKSTFIKKLKAKIDWWYQLLRPSGPSRFTFYFTPGANFNLEVSPGLLV